MLGWMTDLLLQVFYLLPDLAAILLVIVGVVALIPEIQQRLTRRIRVVLFFLLCTIGICGVVSSRIQIRHQEQKAALERETLTAQITQLLNDQSEARKESA